MTVLDVYIVLDQFGIEYKITLFKLSYVGLHTEDITKLSIQYLHSVL